MIAEGEDEHRRDMLRLARQLRPAVVAPAALLAFLSNAARLFEDRTAAPRRRPLAGGRYRL